MPANLRVFVNYASEDREVVVELEQWLRTHGYDPWMDKERLLPGQDWRLEIKRAVQQSDVVLVCLSTRSTKKIGYVQEELRLILEAARLRPQGTIYVIPIRLDDCEVPEPLSDWQRVDIWEADAHEKLSRSLKFERDTIIVEKEFEAAEIATAESRTETAKSIEAFVKRFNLDDVIRVAVITHTGGVTLSSLLATLRKLPVSHKGRRIPLQVLLRSKELSDLRRAQAIDRSLIELREFAAANPGFLVEARPYAAPPLLRCIMFEHQDGRHSAYLSFYDWPLAKGLNQRGASSPASLQRVRVESTDWPLEMFLSWFSHLWGIHRIHTVLFDFDDTLFLTTECQVAGWVQALKSAVDGKTFSPADFATEIRRLIDRKVDLTESMTKIFLHEQQEHEILERLFSKIPPLPKLEMLRRHRVRVREELTAEQATPIWDFIEEIKNVRREYQLAIVSATSENLVRQVLERYNLNDLFSYVIGREVPRHRWLAMENKTQQFLRVSNMAGIPLERMVFIGDSDADHKSAAQLGLHFVENRHNAIRHKLATLIKSLDPDGHLSLTGKSGELRAALAEVESRAKAFL